MIYVIQPPLRHGVELESYLFFKTTGKPHYLHNHPKHPQCRIFAQFPRFVSLLTFYPTCLMPGLGDWKARTSVTLNSHLLNAYYVPATVGEA